MALASCSICRENTNTVVENGWHTCMGCGAVLGSELDQRNCSFHEVPTHALRATYTRIKRFRSKIIGGLQRRLNHAIDEEVLGLMGERFPAKTPVPPEHFLEYLGSLIIGRRKPYIHVAYYYEALFGVTLPCMPAYEEKLICRMFEEVFFATDRLKLERPTFPMSTLLRLIVDNFEFSLKTQLVVRFAKRLRCPRRRRRYQEMFARCCEYITKHERTYGAIKALRRKTPSEVAEGPGSHPADDRVPPRFDLHHCTRDEQGGGQGDLRPEQDDGFEKRTALLLMCL